MPLRGIKLPYRILLFTLFLSSLWAVGLGALFFTTLKNKAQLQEQSQAHEVLNLLSQQTQWPQDFLNTKSFQMQVINKDWVVLFDSKSPERQDAKLTKPHSFLLPYLEIKDLPITSFTEGTSHGWIKKENHQWYLAITPTISFWVKFFSSIENYVGYFLFLISISLIAFGLFSWYCFNPLKLLVRSALEIAQGSLQAALPQLPHKKTSDEVGVLQRAIQQLQQHVLRVNQNEIQQLKIELEVQQASAFQKAILPPSYLKTPRYCTASFYDSAKYVSGDFWGILEAQNQVYFYVADVTGHGLSSSMLTTAARGCFSTIQKMYQQNPNSTFRPPQILELANQAILHSAHEELNMTLFLVEVNYLERKIYYANAGHHPAWVLRKTATGYRTLTLRSKGMRLGEREDYITPHLETHDLLPHDILFLFTDGIFDCLNARGQELGKKGIKHFFEQLDSTRTSLTLQELKQQLEKYLKHYTQDAELVDDLFFVFIQPELA